MNLHLWSWPQWIWISYAGLGLVVYATMDGKPIKDPVWRFAPRLVLRACMFGLLYWGGFFP